MNRLIVILCALFLLGGCAPTIRYSPTEIQAFPEKVQADIKEGKVSLGMTPLQVRYALGAPNAVNIIGEDADSRFIEEWMYARMRIRGTRLVFTDNRLTGIISGITKMNSGRPGATRRGVADRAEEPVEEKKAEEAESIK